MKLLVLSGPSNSGKSTTLNILYNMLIQNEAIVTKQKTPLGNLVQNDFESTLQYQNKSIAFITMGDYSRHLVNAIKKYAFTSIDFLIIACNTNLKNPFKAIRKVPSHFILDKTLALGRQSQQQANTNDAQELLSKFQ